MNHEMERIRARMAEEVAACDDLSGWSGSRGSDLGPHLVVPPRQEEVDDDFGAPGGRSLLWVVADECPGSGTGYLVLYDRRRDEFGLAAKGQGGETATLVGWYGSSLRSALEGM